MGIDFGPERWDKVRETYRQWWAGELGRPIIPIELVGRDPGRPEPGTPVLSQATCADFSLSAEAIVDRLDYELSRSVFLGDAFPYVNLSSFGPGIMSAFLGARVDNSTGWVWFRAPREAPIADIHFGYDEGNVWLKRIKDICAAAMERWQGQVLVSMPDLGGNLDVLSTFRPGERLLLDLYDCPDEVVRLCWESHDLWHRFFREINEVLQPVNPGYSDWSSIYSDKPSYILQCDFSYMISPEMFAQFVRPELAATCRRLARTVYHLDGPGQLPHLEQLCAMADLDGIQWVPGAGVPGCAHWPEVYRQIHAAGKKTQIWDGFDAIDAVASQTGDARWIHHRVFARPLSDEVEVRRRLARYGIE